ncbi:MAG TPA: glycosyltransferase family 9 protein, partial [Candidatus Omnitrophota bacterium]|nr:glycosyltransferase family 9 protein [Candidatus Omnitrophota bacterium]
DRIGDVLLSTPVIRSLRDHYPSSFIAMMVDPKTRQLVEGNPYLDEVIVFDKDKNKGLIATLRFARRLKREKFDVIIVLHPTVRVHLLAFLAGIKERIGYLRKGSYFLTKSIPHYKQEGRKHESEYNFDLLRPLGISGISKQLYMPIKAAAERVVEQTLIEAGIVKENILIAVNPAASCLSKIWPLSKLAKVIDRLQFNPNVRVLIVADNAHKELVEELLGMTKTIPLDFTGRFDLSCLASLFKRVDLLISNDSGPVHMAVAVGTPVISIFGRNQPGLGPKRWGPLGLSDVVLHKKTDCDPCLAHACEKEFRCLDAISVDEVILAAQKILKTTNLVSFRQRA